LLLKSLPSFHSTGNHILIDKLFDVRFADKLTKAYTNVNLGDMKDDDIAIDASGYTGKFHREKIDERKLLPISYEEFVSMF
jgi:hypothetical protein